MNSPDNNPNSIAAEIVAGTRAVMQTSEGNIPLHVPVFGKNAAGYVNECITTGWVSSAGKYVDRFEEDLAKFTGAKRAVAVSNGTSALHIALKLCGVEPGDEVLLPSLTFVATANAVSYCHATPHFVEVESHTLGIDADAIRAYLDKIAEVKDGKCVNRNTGQTIRCLIGMHAFGHPFELESVLKLCEDFSLDLVEDAAESIGSFYQQRHTGLFGRVGILSFNGNKTITTGGGGAIVTDDESLADLAKHLTTTGKQPHAYRYFHDMVAYNYRMPNLNAALGCSQLEDLPAILESKREIATGYLSKFANNPEFEILSEPENCRSNYWLNALVLSNANSKYHDTIIQQLNQSGIIVRPIWEPLHTLPMYRDAPRMNLDVTMNLAQRIINLPSTPRIS